MLDHLQQHQQLQELFAHDDSLEVEYAIDSNTASAIGYSNISCPPNYVPMTPPYKSPDSDDNTNSNPDSHITDHEYTNQQQQSPQQSRSSQEEEEEEEEEISGDAGTSGMIITTHYYSNTGKRRTYHNYYYDYPCEEQQSPTTITASNPLTDSNNIISTSTTTNNNNNYNSVNLPTTTTTSTSPTTTSTSPTTTSTMNNNDNERRGIKRNLCNNDIANGAKRPMIMNVNNDLNFNTVDAAMLHAIREKVLHTPTGTNFDVICITTPHGGRTIATHTNDQVSHMRMYDNRTQTTFDGQCTLLTSAIPLSLIKQRFLLTHLLTRKPMPSIIAALNKPMHYDGHSWVGTPAANTEAPSAFINTSSANVARQYNAFSAQFGNVVGCTRSVWHRHMVEMSGMTVKCTDIFTEQEYLVKMVHEPMDKVKEAYYRLQMDKQFLRSNYYGHRLVRAAHDVIPYVSSVGDTMSERSFIIVEPKTASYDEIAIWTGGSSMSNIVSMGRNITGNSVEDLHSYIRRKRRLCETEVRELFHQIAETVRVCHRNGIILRDLKLKRFYFIDQERKRLQYESLEGCMILADANNDILSDKIGCPLYTAPELLCTAPTYRGKPADMWSLGVILYTMLVGQYPFYEKGSCSLIQIIRQCSAYFPSSLSRSARSLIMTLLNKSWSERLRIDQIFCMPWMRDYKPEWSCIPYDAIVKCFADPEDLIENLQFGDSKETDDEHDTDEQKSNGLTKNVESSYMFGQPQHDDDDDDDDDDDEDDEDGKSNTDEDDDENSNDDDYNDDEGSDNVENSNDDDDVDQDDHN